MLLDIKFIRFEWYALHLFNQSVNSHFNVACRNMRILNNINLVDGKINSVRLKMHGITIVWGQTFNYAGESILWRCLVCPAIHSICRYWSLIIPIEIVTHSIIFRNLQRGHQRFPLVGQPTWLPAWWALWLPWWPPAGCNNALMYSLIFIMNFCYCFIAVFCWK